MKQEKNQFRLEVRLENQLPMKIDVIDTITAGLDPRNDLVLIGKKIQDKHLAFEVKGENLALHYLGLTNQSFLNQLPLEHDKTYLLDIGDVLNFPGTKITILKELVSIHETQTLKPKILESKKLFDDVAPRIFHEPPRRKTIKERTREEVKKEKFSIIHFLDLWKIKIYAIVTDFFISYFIVTTLFPLILIDKYVHDAMCVAKQIIFPHQEHFFFILIIATFLINFVQTIVFGSTFGQFLVGLRHMTRDSLFKMILARIKAFFFSFLFLPAQNSFKINPFYKFMRKFGLIILFIFIAFVSSLLPAKYSVQIKLLEENALQKSCSLNNI